MQSQLINKFKMPIEVNEKAGQEICRLCLKSDNLFVNIYNEDKNMPLDVLLFDLFNIKVEKSDIYPANICYQCLYMTKTFFGFRENVKKCDAKLKSDFTTSNSSKKISTTSLEQTINNDDYEVIIVNPYQEYESSEDEFSETEFHENNTTTENIITNSEKDNPLPTPPPPTRSNNSSFEAPTMEVDTVIGCKNTFHCLYCDMAFAQRIECVEHESRHDAANPYICHFCPYRTISRPILIHHIKGAHDNDRPYVCSLCGKGFCRRSDLKKHTIVHTGVRPFTCHICGKRFSRNTNLKKHSRIHSGLKVYGFPNNSRNFSRKLIHNQKKISTSFMDDKYDLEPQTPLAIKQKQNNRKKIDFNSSQYLDKNFNRNSNLCGENDICESGQHKAMHLNKNFPLKYCGGGEKFENPPRNENRMSLSLQRGESLRFPDRPSLQLGFYNEVETEK